MNFTFSAGIYLLLLLSLDKELSDSKDPNSEFSLEANAGDTDPFFPFCLTAAISAAGLDFAITLLRIIYSG